MKNRPILYPMLLIPAYKDYLWGGERLAGEYGKETLVRPIAESWELSCHPDGYSTIASGIYKGRRLADVLCEYPEMVGPCAARSGRSGKNGSIASGKNGNKANEVNENVVNDNVVNENVVNDNVVNENTACGACGAYDTYNEYGAFEFPILIKLIDAKQNLSLQVHPDDAYARLHEDSAGKNEAWYVVDCEPGASLILGLKVNIPAGDITPLLQEGKILDNANIVPIKPGDCFLVPAGLLHAIGGGAIIAEVQQSSNITYRVYDYGRLGADGKPRELHIQQAADVIDTALRTSNSAAGAIVRQYDGYSATLLIDWQYFKLIRLDIGAGGTDGTDGAAGSAQLDCGNAAQTISGTDPSSLAFTGSFHALLVIEGEFIIEYCDNDPNSEFVHITNTVEAAKGSCVYIPPGLGQYKLRGCGKILLTTI